MLSSDNALLETRSPNYHSNEQHEIDTVRESDTGRLGRPTLVRAARGRSGGGIWGVLYWRCVYVRDEDDDYDDREDEQCIYDGVCTK